MKWFCSSYLIDNSLDELDQLLGDFMVHTAVSMVQYKRQAVKYNHAGCCTTEEFEAQVTMALSSMVGEEDEEEYRNRLEMLDSKEIPNLDWVQASFTMSPIETPAKPYELEGDYLIKGTNEADRIFFQGFDCSFQLPGKGEHLTSHGSGDGLIEIQHQA